MADLFRPVPFRFVRLDLGLDGPFCPLLCNWAIAHCIACIFSGSANSAAYITIDPSLGTFTFMIWINIYIENVCFFALWEWEQCTGVAVGTGVPMKATSGRFSCLFVCLW